ncbi:hypothetical protein FHS19_005593 [Paenibacillus rhizosphaerae]|uniref:SLH domain-containing protein n=1 Tax=Paenibacillus rhizosphaerae TaxID=297318 RepID=A0A839TUP7_9BACL|nr:S-layer homology domain-containing protein [Paenibacillus rhizosphaerae]MBB3130874.1 hypothetical protein [Paenibacillus rhizosphaerae]
MSNKSYLFKENSNVMNVQGGEKKVMKKILTVALSTAMAFSMFASVAFGDTAVTPQQKFDALAAKGIFNGYPDGSAHLEKEMTRAEFAKVITKLLGLKEVTGTLSYKDKGYDAKNWAVPYIEAVTAAGIMQGQDSVKKIFNYNGKVTIQEMATVLTRALKLEVPANPDNNAADWAKGYVQAAIDKGLISKDANFKANASRSQLVEAAYAIDQATNITFTYKVVDPSNVEFTLSTGEVVKVKLDKPLEANKETEVKFKDAAGNEYTAKVTWVSTAATKVDSVTAGSLKQLVVKFDGTVDQTTAENVNNYSISNVAFESATLSADKTSVTLLVAETSSALSNQKQTTLKVNNVKTGDGTKTISQSVNFTPIDVAVPEVTEVKGLGTKAFKVKFSEPVNGNTVNASSFRIDGNVIAASVKYVYPDTAIVTTDLTTGDHTLRVSGVQDYSGLQIVPTENKFTVAEDTAAPTVVSVKSNDLKQVVVEFDETIKSVTSAYANVSSNTATIAKISDNKVTLNFSNPLNYTENTLHIAGVTDYSNNTANLDTTVTPTLDTVRPTVIGSNFYKDGNNYYVELQFSKSLDSASATNKDNYVLKNADGTIADVTGVDSNGHPVITPGYNEGTKKVTVNLGTGLDASKTYTLTAAGVKDTAYVSNVLLPYTVTLAANTVQNGEISRAWADVNTGSKPNYVYLQFNKTLSTSGAGSALDAAKYFVEIKGKGEFQLTKDSNDIDLISTNTVRIAATNTALPAESWNDVTVKASYVADADGNYFSQGNFTVSKVLAKTSAVTVSGEVYATSSNEVKVKFDAPLSNVNVGDFFLEGTLESGKSGRPTSYTQSDDKKTLTLAFASGTLNAQVPGDVVLKTVASPSTQDAYGNKIDANLKLAVKDGIAPSSKGAVFTKTDKTYTVEITANESLKQSADVTVNFLKGLFTLNVNGDNATINDVVVKGDTITVTATADSNVIGDNDTVTLKFDSSKNGSAKAITDNNNNALTISSYAVEGSDVKEVK